MKQNKEYPIFKGEREAEAYLRGHDVQRGELGPYRSLAKEMIHSADMEVQSSGLNLKRAIENEQRTHDAQAAMLRHRRRVKLGKCAAAVAVPLLGALIIVKVHRRMNPPQVSRAQELINTAQERIPMAAPLLEKLPDPVEVEKKVKAARDSVASATKHAAQEVQLPSLGEVKESLGGASEKVAHALSGATSTVASKVSEVDVPRATAPLRELPLTTVAKDAWREVRSKAKVVTGR